MYCPWIFKLVETWNMQMSCCKLCINEQSKTVAGQSRVWWVEHHNKLLQPASMTNIDTSLQSIFLFLYFLTTFISFVNLKLLLSCCLALALLLFLSFSFSLSVFLSLSVHGMFTWQLNWEALLDGGLSHITLFTLNLLIPNQPIMCDYQELRCWATGPPFNWVLHEWTFRRDIYWEYIRLPCQMCPI